MLPYLAAFESPFSYKFLAIYLSLWVFGFFWLTSHIPLGDKHLCTPSLEVQISSSATNPSQTFASLDFLQQRQRVQPWSPNLQRLQAKFFEKLIKALLSWIKVWRIFFPPYLVPSLLQFPELFPKTFLSFNIHGNGGGGLSDVDRISFTVLSMYCFSGLATQFRHCPQTLGSLVKLQDRKSYLISCYPSAKINQAEMPLPPELCFGLPKFRGRIFRSISKPVEVA